MNPKLGAYLYIFSIKFILMAKFQKRFEGKSNRRFEKSSRFEGRGAGRFEKGGRFEERESRERFRELVDAVCDQCGRECQLPFKPTGDRPVYCSSCFRKPEGEARGIGS